MRSGLHVRRYRAAWYVGALLALAGTTQAAAIGVTLATSLPDGQPVGQVVGWLATTPGASDSTRYRFWVRRGAEPWNLVREYGRFNFMKWTTLEEGSFTILTQVLDVNTGDTGQAASTFRFVSRLSGASPGVSRTAHPLVALYSAPACASGSVRVNFRAIAGGPTRSTQFKTCQPGQSLNFYVAGMLANTVYYIQQQNVTGGSLTPGPLLTFRTGTLPIALPEVVVERPANSQTDSVFDLQLLGAFAFPGQGQYYPPLALDLAGRPVWYLPFERQYYPGTSLIRPVDGGTFTLMSSVVTRDGFSLAQTLWEADVAGTVLRETSVEALNRQLKARGADPISWLDHEALRLRNGHTLIFAPVERLLTNVQGPGTVNVVGDMILDLDENFQIGWTWNPFDHLDVSRKSTLNTTCQSNFTCGPLRLAPVANDWTHSNSIDYIAKDGSLIVSVRNQDWVIKIDYRDGTGPGTVLWRLGKDGDFSLTSSDPWPWFSHQHDANFTSGGLVVYDNGNTRVEHAGGNSRGQVWLLDEARRTATLTHNFDLGVYASAVGSAQRLPNGNYQFLSGYFEIASQPSARAAELLPSGTPAFSHRYGSYVYRAFRMKSLDSYPPD